MKDDIYGLDVGTMNLCSATRSQEKKDEVKLQTLRNMYLEVSPDMIASSEIADTDLDFVEQRDEEDEVENIYIIGEDAYRFANIFNRKAQRPMEKGVISTGNIDAIDVLTLMVERLVGKSDGNGQCVYSVPAEAVDTDIPPVLYHETVFGRILTSLGYKSKPLNEALSIVFSECQKTKFTGIAISFGSGLTNVACAYKGTPTLTFSVSRGGDWIDSNVAMSLGLQQTRVTSVKEKNLDLLKPGSSKNKKERRVQEALAYYYTNLIEYTLDMIMTKFNEESEGLDIDEQIPLIISGGTSKPKNFEAVFKEVFSKKKDFPYEISEIRQAKDPLTAVAYGCLIYALWDQKRNKKK